MSIFSQYRATYGDEIYTAVTFYGYGLIDAQTVQPLGFMSSDVIEQLFQMLAIIVASKGRPARLEDVIAMQARVTKLYTEARHAA